MHLAVVLLDRYHILVLFRVVLELTEFHIMLMQVVIECLRIVGEVVGAVAKAGAEMDGWVS